MIIMLGVWSRDRTRMAEKVSLKEFLRTLKLGKIHLGMHEDDVTAILGKPDFLGGSTRKYRKPSLWAYGNIELIYDYDTRLLDLILINFWGPQYPSGGTAIELDPWVIRGGLQPGELIPLLDEEGINHLDVEPINPGTRQMLVNSAITMIFNNETDTYTGEIGLCKLYAAK